MQTVFVIEAEWNLALFEKILRHHKKSGRADNTFDFWALHWTIVDHREIRAEIYGARPTTIPRILKNANFDIEFYDFIVNAHLPTGIYRHIPSGANAEVTLQIGHGGQELSKIEISATSLEALNTLYALVMWRLIEPERNE